MAEVLYYMEISYAASVPRLDNLDGYTKGMLSVAYQASWNSLTNSLSSGFISKSAVPKETVLRIPVPVLRARLSQWRVYILLTLNVLLTMAGMALALLQHQAEIRPVTEPEKTAILLDASRVFDHGASPWQALDPPQSIGAVRLRIVPVTGSSPPYVKRSEQESPLELDLRSSNGLRETDEDDIELLPDAQPIGVRSRGLK